MKRILTKIVPIFLLIALLITTSACDLGKLWGYITGESIGSFDGSNDDSDLVYNQGTIETTINPLADTIEDILPSVVDVTCTATYRQLLGSTKLFANTGSGVVIDEDEEYLYVLISYQTMYFPKTAVDQNGQILNFYGTITVGVKFMDGVDCGATFVKDMPSIDSGLLKVKKSDVVSEYKVATIPHSWLVKDGEEIIAVSNPLGVLGGTVTTGIVSAEREMEFSDELTMEVLQTDAELTVNSGGILFTKSGSLLGIVYAKAIGTGIEGLTFAIPLVNILDEYHSVGFLKDIVIGG